MTRTFVAIELDAAMRALLERRIARLRQVAPGVRWTDPAKLHLTLAFLGELNDALLAAAMEATEVAAREARPFRVELGQSGFFGPKWAPRVIWVGVGGEMAELLAVHGALARELEVRGFAGEERPFSPHLTLARLKEQVAPETLGALLRAIETPIRRSDSGRMWVERLSVMKSELAQPSARYTCLGTYPLGAGERRLAEGEE